jgi:hypothetical protein
VDAMLDLLFLCHRNLIGQWASAPADATEASACSSFFIHHLNARCGGHCLAVHSLTGALIPLQVFSLCLLFFFFLWDWSLNSGLHTCKARHSTAWATPPVHFPLVISGMESCELSPSTPWGLALNCCPPISASQVARITDSNSQLRKCCEDWAPGQLDYSTLHKAFSKSAYCITQSLFIISRLPQ